MFSKQKPFIGGKRTATRDFAVELRRALQRIRDGECARVFLPEQTSLPSALKTGAQFPLSAGKIRMPGERKPMSIDELTAAVLDLPPHERAQLIEKVESSLYPLDDIDPTVLEGARRELADMKAGRVKGIPMEELLDELDRMAL
jgi:hypothetical protein